MKKKMSYLMLLFTAIFMVACTPVEDAIDTEVKAEVQEEAAAEEKAKQEEEQARIAAEEQAAAEELAKAEAEKLAKEEEEQERIAQEKAAAEEAANELFAGFTRIEVDGGDLSGHRESNVVVNIGFGDREYWAFTNEHGQLVRVVADQIVLQDDDNEAVLSSGRYYSDEAKVPGTESQLLDEGHVIADSLGGVANAYNITPQESTLNRHGDQAYMEKVIRDAGGASNFEAVISYPDTKTQIPSSYQFTYTVMGNTVTDTFDNINPDEANASLGLTGEKTETEAAEPASAANAGGDLSSVDTNGNGKVTIQEAKDAGFSMPIYSDHWLYPYMDDRNNNGMVGE